MTVVATSRLTLRPFVEADIPAYQALRRDALVTRYLPSHTANVEEADANSAKAARAFAALWENERSIQQDRTQCGHGSGNRYGPWAVERRADGALIGHAGLRFVDQMGQTEVLYLIGRAFWGQGYASEAGLASLAHGFGVLDLSQIVAWSMPENTASQAVMARIGMVQTPGKVQVFGVDAIQFAADATTWTPPDLTA